MVLAPLDDLSRVHAGTAPSDRLEMLVEDVCSAVHVGIHLQPEVGGLPAENIKNEE